MGAVAKTKHFTIPPLFADVLSVNAVEEEDP